MLPSILVERHRYLRADRWSGLSVMTCHLEGCLVLLGTDIGDFV
jgi:hypothetical protein